jgi:SPP1 gp7 family putative phage head morphogenesis protein
MTFSETFKEANWKAQVQTAQSFEPKTIHALKGMFAEQMREAIANLEAGRRDKIIDVSKARADYTNVIRPHLVQAMTTAAVNAHNLLRPRNPHKGLMEFLSVFALNWLNIRVAQSADQVTGTTTDSLRAIIDAGYANGDSIPTIAAKIQDTFPDYSDYRAEMTARTEIQAVANQGTLEGYWSSGVVGKVEFWAAQDERECEYCAEYHGQQFNKGEEMPIPLHPNCRCVYLAVLK